MMPYLYRWLPFFSGAHIRRITIRMNEYQLEQWAALEQLQAAMGGFSKKQKRQILQEMAAYREFRRQADQFSRDLFGPFCTSACFQSKRSACCSRDGIITFWADMVVNACASSPEQLTRLREAIKNPFFDHKCIYLTPGGCLWSVRPLVCAMFLCDRVQDAVFSTKPIESDRWNKFKAQAKSFRWPDRPVLFDRLETLFIDAGCDSSLMYLNKSPGLLRIKKQAGFF